MKDDRLLLNLLRNVIRLGTVSSVEGRTARVMFPDRDNLVSGPLMISRGAGGLTIDDIVLCIYLPNGKSDGFIISSFEREG